MSTILHPSHPRRTCKKFAAPHFSMSAFLNFSLSSYAWWYFTGILISISMMTKIHKQIFKYCSFEAMLMNHLKPLLIFHDLLTTNLIISWWFQVLIFLPDLGLQIFFRCYLRFLFSIKKFYRKIIPLPLGHMIVPINITNSNGTSHCKIKNKDSNYKPWLNENSFLVLCISRFDKFSVPPTVEGQWSLQLAIYFPPLTPEKLRGKEYGACPSTQKARGNQSSLPPSSLGFHKTHVALS